MFEVADGWWMGPATYAAGTGQRGGFYVGGLEVQHRWALPWDLHAVTGLYVGGGGGGAAPVGGGLMLRPALTLLKDLGPLQAGVTWSQVRFPSGDIRSTQAGLVLAWDGTYRYHDVALAGRRVATAQRSGLGLDRFGPTVGRYALSDGSGRRIGLIGARAEQSGAGGWHHGFEAAAAASGGAAGYMELLGSTGWEMAPVPGWRALKVGARGALGLGGGGGMPSGGGLIGKAAATLTWTPVPGWTVGVESGRLFGLHGQPRAQATQAWLAVDLEPNRSSDSGPAWSTIGRRSWSLAMQHPTRVARKDGTTAPLDTIGLKLDHYLNDHLYLTGQAHSAYAGGAGAYSMGMIGAGAAWRQAFAGLTLGAEVLAGTAGGGGVDTGSGALAQGLAWAGWPIAGGELRVGAGAQRSASGRLSSPLLEISWSHAFGRADR